MSSANEQLPSTKDVVTRVFGDLKDYSKQVGQIPSEDYDYHQAFPGFRKQVEEQSAALLELMDSCTKLLPKRRRVSLIGAVKDNAGSSHRQLTENERTVVMESIDSLLENVDTVLDELRGRKMRSADQLSVTFGSELVAGAGASSAGMAPDGTTGVLRVAPVMRPQLTFERPVDNSDAPFVPTYYDAAGKAHTGTAGVHPFAEEINAATIPPEQLLPKADIPSVPLQTCPLTFIDTPEELQRVVEQELLQTTEIAVDLEHHDFYSYQGFTCLMQISSRTADYIVDCLKLRASMHLLSPVFLNPSILKVFHGAREDVRWLQKDFGLYLINFVDTGIALQTLHMPYSLAFAVDHFCQVKLNKKYQTADWRVRPLSAEMVNYARQDTHYLLYVYDRLKALLLNSEGRVSVGNLLLHVYAESRRLSLELYEKPHLYPNESYKAALGRSLGGLSPVQQRVAKEIFNWRDGAARAADDSPTAVLHLSSVLAIASKLPTTARDLLRCCSPVSVVVRRDVGKLVELVKDAVGEAGAAAAAATATGATALSGGQQATGDASVGGTVRDDIPVYQRRPVAVHLPMTGTFPSISAHAAPAAHSQRAHDGAAGAAALDAGKPSAWLLAMRQLASTIAARPPQHVPLPGSEILAVMQATLQKRQLAAVEKERGEGSEENGERARKQARAEGVSSEEEAPHTAAGGKASPSAETEATPMTLPTGAFSLRQEFGTGAQDRKRAKATAAAKKGTKNKAKPR